MAGPCWSYAKKIGVPLGQGRELIGSVRQGMKQDGFEVSVS